MIALFVVFRQHSHCQHRRSAVKRFRSKKNPVCDSSLIDVNMFGTCSSEVVFPEIIHPPVSRLVIVTKTRLWPQLLPPRSILNRFAADINYCSSVMKLQLREPKFQLRISYKGKQRVEKDALNLRLKSTQSKPAKSRKGNIFVTATTTA